MKAPFQDRLARAAVAAKEAGIDALLVTPGADLRYLVGYQALPLERLTCLLVPATGDPLLIVPALEEHAAEASGATSHVAHVTHGETDDAFELVGRELRDRIVGA